MQDYLEAFSLLYQVSPLFLVGLTDSPQYYARKVGDEIVRIVFPIFAAPQQESQYVHCILKNLYDQAKGKNEINQRLLSNFIKICDAMYP